MTVSVHLAQLVWLQPLQPLLAAGATFSNVQISQCVWAALLAKTCARQQANL
jgi:hypothetical protein